MLTSHDLLILAQAAEFMATESDSNDRNGRCSSYLYEVARKARAEANSKPYTLSDYLDDMADHPF